ncbi:hypothetical protein CYMTET_19860 [Cymbomonas tetramitiformis]|uniref:Uncharacterized protein n=1 Tax=Cymbomonas tetramitiformis TaxID=36881 RepID=A0AAE0L4J4_9CHLO|nr:hypothetical protein CYMTET_19860 [Cymbomonas tetramitiformis]
MWHRAAGDGRWRAKYGSTETQGYSGGALHLALRRLSKGETLCEGEWDLQSTAGVWNFTDWAAVKLKYGQWQAVLLDETGETALQQTLSLLLPVLRRDNARLRLLSIVVTDSDRWAQREVKQLARRPKQAWRRVPKYTLDRLVRLWQSAPSVTDKKQLARIRTSLAATAKKSHDFIFRHSFICRVRFPEALNTSVMKGFLLQCVDAKFAEGATRNFVRRRVRVVRTAKRKISDVFCNLSKVSLCTDNAYCRCDRLSADLPRRNGHVCFRTTELSGEFLPLNRSLRDTPAQIEETADFLLASTTDFLSQLTFFETVSTAAIRRLLPWQCSVDGGARVTVIENFSDETFFVAVCGAEGLKVQVTWHRFIFLLKRLDACGVARGRAKTAVTELIRELVRRLCAWSQLVTQDYWITPYFVQDAIRFCFSLLDELFASPLDVSLNSAMFCTPYSEDTVFGSIDNAYRFLWHVLALGNPIYTVSHIRKCIAHAILSARTTRKPVRVVLVVPYWERWDECDGVELVCLLQKKKFKFLAPQSALGFADRSTGARFDVGILLIQNRAAAKLKPVIDQGLSRLSRAVASSVNDRGVMYSAEWGLDFCWRLVMQVRPQTRGFAEEVRILDRFRKLMKGGVAAGLLLQSLGGDVAAAVMKVAGNEKQAAIETGGTGVPALTDVWQLATKMSGLARGPLDRNVAVGFGVCCQVYQGWLREERDGGGYERVTMESVEAVRKMRLSFRAAGLDQVATFFTDGIFGTLYLLLKHKDSSLWEKRRPVVPCFASPDRMLQNRVGRALCFLIGGLTGHFNVAATQEIVGRLSLFNSAIEAGDTVMAAGFDVKEMLSYVCETEAVCDALSG